VLTFCPPWIIEGVFLKFPLYLKLLLELSWFEALFTECEMKLEFCMSVLEVAWDVCETCEACET